MRQVQSQQPIEGFKRSSQPVFLTDNRQDEMMMNVLELYPHKKQHIFRGDKGLMRKKLLQQDVRAYFNYLQGEEDENYFNAKGRLKDRIKKGLKKVSINNVKKGIKKIGEGAKKVGRAAKRAALAPARGAFLGLVRVNFRGSASRFNLLTDAGKEKLNKKWEKLGGKLDALDRAIDAGKGKHALACGLKCRAKAGKNPQLPEDAQSDFYNLEPATTAALISAGGGVLAATMKAVSDKSNYKSQIELAQIEADAQKAQDAEKKFDDTMSPQDRALAEEIVKAQESSFDAVKAITDNPNLTAEEKTAALEDMKEDIVDGGLSTGKKIGIAVGILALLGIGFYVFNKNKN